LFSSDLRHETGSLGYMHEITTNPLQLASISNDVNVFIKDVQTTYSGIYMPTPKKWQHRL